MTPRPLDALLDAFADAVRDRSLIALVLSRPTAAAPADLQRVTVRRVVLGGEERLAFVHRHATRDVTKNATLEAARAAVAAALDPAAGASFAHATLRTAGGELQLRISRKGRATLIRVAAAGAARDDRPRPSQDDATRDDPHRPSRADAAWDDPHRPSRDEAAREDPYRPSRGDAAREDPHRPSRGDAARDDPHRPSRGDAAREDPPRPSRADAAWDDPHRPSRGDATRDDLHRPSQEDAARDDPQRPRQADSATTACAAAPSRGAWTESARHDRAKRRHVDVDAPWLRELGVVDARGRVVPAMAAKFRQIDKFVEIVAGALAASSLADGRPLRVFDFGCGKGHLTFAVFDHLRGRGIAARVTGVELRAELVDAANRSAERLGFAGLDFVQGDLRRLRPEAMDVTIALHACDTATDEALALGIAAGAALLIASPCCHRELRPQLRWPAALAPLLRHGVHAGQEAEMLTDSLRVLALEAAGYAAKAFEFVSPEHTARNKMILATRRAAPPAAAADTARAELVELKRFWGIREQALERLLSRERS